MPDYDPKSIPILDDIIDGEINGEIDGAIKGESAETAEAGDEETIPEQINAEQINTDITAAEIIQHDSTLDLFDDSDSDADSTKHEPYIPDTFFDDLKHDDDLEHEHVTGEDQAHDEQDSDDLNNESQSHESALIDYQAEDEASQNDIITVDDQISSHATSSQTMTEGSATSLNSIVEDVVEDVIKQLMPDLEQQLRFMIKQALEDKLPADITDRISTNNDE